MIIDAWAQHPTLRFMRQPLIRASRYRSAILFAVAASLGCSAYGEPAHGHTVSTPCSSTIPEFGYKLVQVLPHDRKAFTEGFAFKDGVLYESTGMNGASNLRAIELQSGQILASTGLDRQYFGEGITLLGDKIFQLTWYSHVGFIYDRRTLRLLGKFHYEGEGWGLTDNGKSLIVSDGSSSLRFLDPAQFRTQRVITVRAAGRPVSSLNELEYVSGKIYANVWRSEKVAEIDEQTGDVTGWINLQGLNSDDSHPDEEAVLNGIAHDAIRDNWFVTGKLWLHIYEIKIVRESSKPSCPSGN